MKETLVCTIRAFGPFRVFGYALAALSLAVATVLFVMVALLGYNPTSVFGWGFAGLGMSVFSFASFFADRVDLFGLGVKRD